MDLKTWRAQRAEGELMQLPSGLVVKLRRVSLMDLALRGDVPTPLAAQVNTILDKGLQSLTVENAPKHAATINLVVKAAVLEPRVGDEADAETLAVDELPWVDRLAIFRDCNRYAEVLKPFRPEQAAAVESA